jgi:hypothetical protein
MHAQRHHDNMVVTAIVRELGLPVGRDDPLTMATLVE